MAVYNIVGLFSEVVPISYAVSEVALDDDFDLSRYYPTGKFYCDLDLMKHICIVFNICFMLDRNLQTVSFPMLGHVTVRVITCFGVIL